ncbi:MAG: hypothetical protein AABX53_02455 [Nanoarchaeota archaeon]
MPDSSRAEEPPDSSRRYFARREVEDHLRTAAGQVINACDKLMKGETPNGELEYLGKLAEHLRQRVGIEGNRRSIRDTTYLGGLIEMLEKLNDIPHGATFPYALLEFADGIERLPQSNSENIAKYKGALTSLVSYITAQESSSSLR